MTYAPTNPNRYQTHAFDTSAQAEYQPSFVISLIHIYFVKYI